MPETKKWVPNRMISLLREGLQTLLPGRRGGAQTSSKPSFVKVS